MVLAGVYPHDRALAHAQWAQRYTDRIDPVRSAGSAGSAVHNRPAFGARLPIKRAHDGALSLPAYLLRSSTLGRMHPTKVALPNSSLNKRVASVINGDKDAESYIEAHGPIETWNTSAVTSMSHMFQRGIQAKSQVHA